MPDPSESPTWRSRLVSLTLGLAFGLAAHAAATGPGAAPPPQPAPAPPFAWAQLSSRTLRARRLAAIHRALARGQTTYEFTIEDPLPPLAAAGK